MTDREIASGREWLIDCGAEPEDVAGLSGLGVERMLDRHYDGGVAQFQSDGNGVDDAPGAS